MKKMLILFGLVAAVAAMAQSHISVGVRGGYGGFLPTQTGVDGHVAPNAMLDVQFAHYWSAGEEDLGLRTGLDVGFAQARYTQVLNDHFVNIDYLGHPMEYTVTASSVAEQMMDVQLEVPLLFAMRANGFILNVGPKLLIPMWFSNRLDINGLNISAYYPEFGVTVPNELITGSVSENLLHQQSSEGTFVLSVLAYMDLGYEWRIRRTDNLIGVSFFAEASPWTYSQPAHKGSRPIEVAPIINPDNPPAQVTVHRLSDVMPSMPVFLNFGLKLYYALEVADYRSHGLHRAPR